MSPTEEVSNRENASAHIQRENERFRQSASSSYRVPGVALLPLARGPVRTPLLPGVELPALFQVLNFFVAAKQPEGNAQQSAGDAIEFWDDDVAAEVNRMMGHQEGRDIPENESPPPGVGDEEGQDDPAFQVQDDIGVLSPLLPASILGVVGGGDWIMDVDNAFANPIQISDDDENLPENESA